MVMETIIRMNNEVIFSIAGPNVCWFAVKIINMYGCC